VEHETNYEPPVIERYYAPNYYNGATPIEYINKNNIQIQKILLYNPYGIKPDGENFYVDAEFAFFPTKMRFGDLTDEEKSSTTLTTKDSHSLVALTRDGQDKYQKIIYQILNGNATATVLDTNVIEPTIENGLTKKYFSDDLLRKFIYVERNNTFSNNLGNANSLENIDDTKGVYVGKQANIFNSIVFNTVMPTYNEGDSYVYDGLTIEQAELRCDAGSKDLIVSGDNGNFDFGQDWVNYYQNNLDNNDFMSYHNMKDGITYAIRKIPAITKKPSNKFVFSWILYL